MTDKELKKLSRLELLELLLNETRENERLKEEIAKAKQENAIEKSAQHLSDISSQLEAALKKVNLLAGIQDDNDETADDQNQADDFTDTEQDEGKESTKTDDAHIDFRIYKRLMYYYISNPDAVDSLPKKLRKAVKKRIDEITDRMNSETNN